MIVRRRGAWPNPRSAAGFTLVELLVVLAIFGLMSLLLFDSFHFTSDLTSNGHRRLDRAREFALASTFLRNQFADIRPLPVSLRDTGPAVAFDGRPEGVAFVGAPPSYLSPGGFQELSIAEEGGRAGRRLTVRWHPLGSESTDGSFPPSVLLDDIASAEFAYFGPAAAREPPDWHATWDGAAGLPMLIRLRVTYHDGSAAPDLIVAPRPTEPAFQ